MLLAIVRSLVQSWRRESLLQKAGRALFWIWWRTWRRNPNWHQKEMKSSMKLLVLWSLSEFLWMRKIISMHVTLQCIRTCLVLNSIAENAFQGNVMSVGSTLKIWRYMKVDQKEHLRKLLPWLILHYLSLLGKRSVYMRMIQDPRWRSLASCEFQAFFHRPTWPWEHWWYHIHLASTWLLSH